MRDRDDALVVLKPEQRHAAPAAAFDRHLVQTAADDLPAIGDKHKLVGRVDEERRHDLACHGHIHVLDSLTATAGGPVLVGRAELPVAFLGDRQDVLLVGGHGLEFGLVEHGRPLLVALHVLELAVRAVVALDPRFGAHRLNVLLAPLGRGFDMAQDRQRDHPVALGEPDAAHSLRGAAAEQADIGDRESNRLALSGREQYVVVARARPHADQPIVPSQPDRDDPHRKDVSELAERDRPDGPAGGREHGDEFVPRVLVLGQRQDGRDRLALVERQQVDERLAARLRGRQRQAVDLELVNLARGREEQHRSVGVDDVDLRHEVLVAGAHPGAALAAAALGAVGHQRDALDVAAVADGDHHVLALDEVLDVVLELTLLDLGAARVGELLLHLEKLAAENVEQPLARAQDVEIIGDATGDLLELLGDLVAFQAGEAMQAQVEDRLRLGLAEPVVAVDDAGAGVVDELDQGPDHADRPGLRHQLLARRGGIGGGADERDDRIEVDHREGQADEHVGAVARLAELERRAPADDLLAKLDERGDHVLERHELGPAAFERQHVGAERGLQRGEAEKLVEHDLGDGVALELDDDAQAVAVGLVAQLGDAFDALVAHHLGDALDHAGLVDLVRHLGDDDRLAVLADLLHVGAAAHRQQPAPGLERLVDAAPAHDDSAGGEVGRRHQLHQLGDRHRRVVDVGAAGVDDLAEVVRRNVGRHADRDAAGAVDEQVGKARRKRHRLLAAVVVVGLEIDGVLVDVLEQRHRRAREPNLGVAHRRRGVAVHRAEVALAVDQRQAHGEVLRHAHHRVVDRGVAVGVVLAHHVADHAGRLARRLVGRVAGLVHGEEDAAVHRLQAVAHVGQRAGDDHAHGVIEVGALHLLLDRDRRYVVVLRRCGVAHGRWCGL